MFVKDVSPRWVLARRWLTKVAIMNGVKVERRVGIDGEGGIPCLAKDEEISNVSWRLDEGCLEVEGIEIAHQ